MTAEAKLIKDLTNDFSQLEAQRAYIEVNRADQSNSAKTTFRDKNYLVEAGQVSFTHATTTNYTIYVTLIPVYSENVPNDKVVFLATVEIYIKANKGGAAANALAGFPPRKDLVQSFSDETGISIESSGRMVYTNTASNERGLTFTYLTDVAL